MFLRLLICIPEKVRQASKGSPHLVRPPQQLKHTTLAQLQHTASPPLRSSNGYDAASAVFYRPCLDEDNCCAYEDATRAEAEPQLHMSQNITVRLYVCGQPRLLPRTIWYSTISSGPRWEAFMILNTCSAEYITILNSRPHATILSI